MRRLSLHHRIFIGMGIGLAAGLTMHATADPESSTFLNVIWWLDLLGKDVFIGTLKMIIAPLIFASIVAGISSLPNVGELGSIGSKIFAYYFCTTALAVAIGVAAVLLIRPGYRESSQNLRQERAAVIERSRAEFAAETGIDPRSDEGRTQFRMHIARKEGAGMSDTALETNWTLIKAAEERGPGDMFREQILIPILSNPFTALAKSPPNALGIIFFAILTGLACTITGEAARPVATFFRGFNKVMMTITLWVMEIAPVAIGCLIASLVATLGYDALRSLGWYCATVIGGIAVHLCLLLTLVAVLGRMSPGTFIRGIQDAWLIAFSTTSSAATLPVTLHCTTKKLDVSEKIADFSLPVGATVNMDGTALYEGVAVIFLIQMYGGLEDVPITLTAMKTFTIFITAVLASIGAAAVPSAGLITMAIVASAVGLPLYYIFLIFAVDRFLDMFRTSTNVLGDAAGAVIVNRLERSRLLK